MGCMESKECDSEDAGSLKQDIPDINHNENDHSNGDEKINTELPSVKMLNYEDYELGELLGEGGMGVVYSATCKQDGSLVAMKFFGYHGRRLVEDDIHREIGIMAGLNGIKGIVQMLGIFYDTESGYIPNKKFRKSLPVIVMEHLAGGEMFTRIYERKTVSELYIARAFKDVIHALDDMHKRGYLHRDLKLENIMLVNEAEDSPVKIIDFGMVVKLPEGSEYYHSKGVQGTRGYVAPESLTHSEYSAKSDLWQAGCTLYALLSGFQAFNPHRPEQIVHGRPFRMVGEGWDTISIEAKDLVARLLRKSVSSRLSAEEVLAHPWLVNTISDRDLGEEYYARVKNLALRQKMKKFFMDNEIAKGNQTRKEKLKTALPLLLSSDNSKRTGDSAEVFENKLKRLKEVILQSYSRSRSESLQSTASGEVQCEATSSSNVNIVNAVDTSDIEFDVDLSSGDMTYSTFVSVLKECGLDELATRKVFKIFDINKTGRVDLKEFLVTMVAFRPDDDEEDIVDESDADVRMYFNIFDISETGYIDLEELRLAVGCIFLDENNPLFHGTDKTDIDVEALFQAIDISDNGRITFDEFKAFYDAVLVQSTKRMLEPEENE
mmetsp:Transcript_20394/g.29293  ORF Transcript_20394/g.29293 Transcript_20394/m.29293 type:complete len:606 (+) Transcript_20394:182-1999(+)|eukprot:CAMPEP_0185021798 /NCGR_PEP_ID=MMETSP1103-20130426/4505_1 /TAXON_ID=36769 /ORGANISM="Paraphysomonas bandaiensis, Strain Caron Lab Isolate" /LENGTH=605 /DNA_ID=CAMNT_0027553541 /DNA_START=102 /DNA_END=1919 /DNA_ORIENTATION=+